MQRAGLNRKTDVTKKQPLFHNRFMILTSIHRLVDHFIFHYFDVELDLTNARWFY